MKKQTTSSLSPELDLLRQLIAEDTAHAIEAMTSVVAEQFEAQGVQLDRLEHSVHDLAANGSRDSNTLRATTDLVDDQEIRIVLPD